MSEDKVKLTMVNDRKNMSSQITAEGIELNEKFLEALHAMENTRKNMFITGRAGTGKSTLLEHFKKTTKKSIAVLAPTGVAALNVGGQTIHSFFKFAPDITPNAITSQNAIGKKIYKMVDALVIDEISMVRADLLDCMDRFLRISRGKKKEPFGGVQMLFIGDLYQLPPVITKNDQAIYKEYKSGYFFDANVFKELAMEFIELEKIYRQKDKKFIALLNAVRNRSVTDEDMLEINKRHNPSFEPLKDEFYINLTTTNDLAATINERELAKLPGKLFKCIGEISGKFERSSMPTELELKLKVGSQVMLLNNDGKRRWVNGTIGKIVEITKDDEDIAVELAAKQIVHVAKHTWDICQLDYNAKTRSLDSKTLGSFRQYPLRLAWAVTIHKGQGKTFDKVIVDIGNGTFTHGQTYVALSRCTSFDGLVLRKPIKKQHIFMDWKIVNFLTKYQYGLSDKKCSLEDKISMIKDAIKRKEMLDIVYLKSSDVKSKRTILPKKIGNMEYMGKKYLGVEAYCQLRKEDRVFRVDRILEIKKV